MTIADAAGLGPWLVAREAAVPGLREGCAARILWAGAPGARAPVALVYVHGFSATGQELRPLPDLVAERLGANLFLARLTGHGQDGAALGRASLEDWKRDVAEALRIGAALGERVIVMACSTGAPLVARALADGGRADAVLFVSPHFGLRNRVAQWLLDAPGARVWGRWIMGAERGFAVLNPAHGAYWTTRYPSRVVHEVAAAVRAGRAAVPRVRVPAFVAACADDRVVSAATARRVMARWAGPVHWQAVDAALVDDPTAHVIAGEIFAPRATEPLAGAMSGWLQGLS